MHPSRAMRLVTACSAVGIALAILAGCSAKPKLTESEKNTPPPPGPRAGYTPPPPGATPNRSAIPPGASMPAPPPRR